MGDEYEGFQEAGGAGAVVLRNSPYI
jgi:hypothetical protein